jgi:heat shock protein HslJ
VRLLAALVGLTLLVSACGGDDVSVGETSGEPDDDPALGDWMLVSGTLGGAPLTPISGYDATISFGADGSFGGRAACNGYGGTTSLDNGSVRLEEFAITEMACEPDVMALEAQFVEALLAVERYEVADGTLTLAGADVELVFEPVPPVPQSELVGTHWTLDTLIDGEVASSTLSTATLRLDEDGSMTGSTGCRTLTGRWLVTGGKLQFPELAAEGECPADLADQDGFVVSVLEGPATVEIDGASLLLTSPGEIGLRYRSDLG